MPDLPSLLRSRGVPIRTEGANVGSGWIGVHCPFCQGSRDFHLGYNLTGHVWKCWRCGFHPGADVLHALLGVDRGEAVELWRSVSSGAPARVRLAERDRQAQRRVLIGGYKHPSGVGPLGPLHRRYLEGRGFDPDELAADWGVLGTGPVSYLDEVGYRHRVLVPILWEGREVSFQARDATGRAERKYMACPTSREAVHHKDVFYMHPACAQSRAAVVVEGITDVWRLGRRAVALFGIQYKSQQVAHLARLFDRVVVAFDGGERQARLQARRLAAQLSACGVRADVENLPPGVDPGGMSADDARHLVREMGLLRK